MIQLRKTRIVMNPAYSKPAEDITDRAKRYRAHHPDVVPKAPKQCGFCGSRRNPVPHHILGDERDSTREGLMWACKSCNAKVAAIMKRVGLGKRTAQFNPPKRRGGSVPGMAEYGAAIKVMRGEFEGDVSKAMATIRATPPELRSRFTARSWPVRKQRYGASGRQRGLFADEVPF